MRIRLRWWPRTPARKYRRLCLRRVLRRRCPQCGRGALFASWARLRERCDHCGLLFRREPGSEMGSMMLSTLIPPVFAAAVFAAITIWTDWGLALSLSVATPLVLAFSYGILPYEMAVWTAVEYLADVDSGEWWARPRS